MPILWKQQENDPSGETRTGDSSSTEREEPLDREFAGDAAEKQGSGRYRMTRARMKER